MLNFLDAGTTWSKILTVKKCVEKDCTQNPSKNLSGIKKEYKIIRTKDLKTLNMDFEITTGHSANTKGARFENEAVALSFGADIKDKGTVTLLDLGSRDAKWVKFKSGKFLDMDWNTNCASATGATIEMLLKFYEINPSDLILTKEKYPVTCGIFGLEKIMEDVSKGIKPAVAISKFITGVAYNAYNFTKNPDKIYLSGGFCENKCFVEALRLYCEVIPIGRYVLADGLYNIYSSGK